jgi:hypothetical protein
MAGKLTDTDDSDPRVVVGGVGIRRSGCLRRVVLCVCVVWLRRALNRHFVSRTSEFLKSQKEVTMVSSTHFLDTGRRSRDMSTPPQTSSVAVAVSYLLIHPK